MSAFWDLENCQLPLNFTNPNFIFENIVVSNNEDRVAKFIGMTILNAPKYQDLCNRSQSSALPQM